MKYQYTEVCNDVDQAKCFGTSQSRTVSLSLAPQFGFEQRLDVSFKPMVSISKSRKYLNSSKIKNYCR